MISRFLIPVTKKKGSSKYMGLLLGNECTKLADMHPYPRSQPGGEAITAFGVMQVAQSGRQLSDAEIERIRGDL